MKAAPAVSTGPFPSSRSSSDLDVRAEGLSRGPLLRHASNPILCPGDMPFRCYTVFNAGATWFEGGVLMLLRVETCARETQFHVARSEDGVQFEVDPEPIECPLTLTEQRHGRAHHFDMRITEMDGVYYLFHAAWMKRWGCCIALSTTRDFVHYQTLPYLSEPANRNAVLFPEKIGGLYARLDRPQDASYGGMWVSYSPDLEFWGRSMPLDLPAMPWNGNKIGAGAIPIRTEAGWLAIYHATDNTCSTENYYLGVMLLDLADPSRILAAPRSFILAAEEPYECLGQTPNVVFTCGAVPMPDGTLNVYYGAADTRMCLAQTTVSELLAYCERS